jgi:hypothetical protein
MNPWRQARLRLIVLLLGIFVLFLPVGSRAASVDEQFRWDIVSLDFDAGTISAGGVASALANDGSKITLTGSGTFEQGDFEDFTDVRGGGTWKTFNPAGAVTGSGTYKVVGFVAFVVAPGTFPSGLTDLIGDPADARAGLVILHISYSDGSKGVLLVSCNLVGTPDSVFEGVTASKGFVDYWNRVKPVGGVDANRTLFHVQHEQ